MDVLVPEETLRDLLKERAELTLLNCGGVDNWEGHWDSLFGDYCGKTLEELEKEIDDRSEEELLEPLNYGV